MATLQPPEWALYRLRQRVHSQVGGSSPGQPSGKPAGNSQPALTRRIGQPLNSSWMVRGAQHRRSSCPSRPAGLLGPMPRQVASIRGKPALAPSLSHDTRGDHISALRAHCPARSSSALAPGDGREPGRFPDSSLAWSIGMAGPRHPGGSGGFPAASDLSHESAFYQLDSTLVMPTGSGSLRARRPLEPSRLGCSGPDPLRPPGSQPSSRNA